mmetsp:Transcript_36208/g.102036  ORF Transcript_36208/g.102036 Transcript_36208/m.102036 type:complete len:257 (+) Transcript_36208:842-1612(+)
MRNSHPTGLCSLSLDSAATMMNATMKAISKMALNAMGDGTWGFPGSGAGVMFQALPLSTKVTHSHGSPNAMLMLKTLLPYALATAISPWPLAATIALANRLGRDVPAAPMVRPTTALLRPTIFPIFSPAQVMKNDKPAIHRQQLKMVSTYKPGLLERSGIVARTATSTGASIVYFKLLTHSAKVTPCVSSFSSSCPESTATRHAMSLDTQRSLSCSELTQKMNSDPPHLMWNSLGLSTSGTAVKTSACSAVAIRRL